MAYLGPVHVAPSTDPTNALMTLDEVKDDLRIDGGSHDDKINRIIQAVTDTIEISLRRPVRKRSYLAYFSRPPEGQDLIVLKRTPIISVDSLEALHNGAWVAVPTTEYHVTRLWDEPSPPPASPVWIEPALDDGWTKIEYDSRRDPFRVTYTAGWDPIPDGIKDGAMKFAVDRFQLPGTLTHVEQYRAGTVVQTMLMQYRAPAGIRFIER